MRLSVSKPEVVSIAVGRGGEAPEMTSRACPVIAEARAIDSSFVLSIQNMLCSNRVEEIRRNTRGGGKMPNL